MTALPPCPPHPMFDMRDDELYVYVGNVTGAKNDGFVPWRWLKPHERELYAALAECVWSEKCVSGKNFEAWSVRYDNFIAWREIRRAARAEQEEATNG